MKIEEKVREEWPKVAIIVLNWNGWRDTIECLESLYQITYPNYDVIVVDNGSQDESIQKIREYCKGRIHLKSNFFVYNSSNKPIKIIEYIKSNAGKEISLKGIENPTFNKDLVIIKNERNYGFAKGVNIGFNYAINYGAQYLLALNNDTVVAQDFLDILIDHLESNWKIGIAGPTCYYYDNPDIIWSGGLKINWWMGTITPAISGKIINVDSVSGCAMIIRRELLKDISLFDERFPFGQEDYEICTRAIRNNYKVVYVPNSKVWHKVSKSRIKLINNASERKALLGSTANLKLKDRLRFFKICSPTRIHYISEVFFYFGFFFFFLPLKAFKYIRNFGFKHSLSMAKSIIKELIDLLL